MQTNERQALIAAMQTKPEKPCNMHTATTELQRYYMAHPISTDGWKAFKASVHKLDASKPWRMNVG